MKLWKIIGLCLASSAVTAGGILGVDAIYGKGFDDCYKRMTGKSRRPKTREVEQSSKAFNSKEVVGFIKHN